MFKNKSLLSLALAMMLIIVCTACKAVTQDEETPQDSKQIADEVVYPLTIVDSYNREVTIESEPMRIISIAPNITETIFALDKDEKLIGRTDFCNYSEQAKSIESIGGLTQPSIEKITDLEPDLIIASAHFEKDVLKKLEDLGLKVIVLYGEENFEGVYEVIGKTGQVLDSKVEADKIISDMQDKIANVKSKVEDASTPSVYYVVGFGQYGDYTAGKDTFIGQMIELAGGKNSADDVEGWNYSLERLIEKDPDILICSAEEGTKEQIMATNGYKDLTAVKEGRLFQLDKDLLQIQGPRLADGVEALAEIIHPDSFK